MIEYHNPQAEVGIENIDYTLSATLTGAESIDVGFLANGFPDSESFLDELAAAMQKLEPGIRTHRYNKGNASIPAPEAMLNEARRDCAAVVAAYGH
jgi:hypothetical protein